ncbi:hypothetical protein CyaNS01_00805 [Cyanobium sp. NS01]|nr:hypothetical protein CyaNS01_00805 [Cyanobium sp. NS01]
MKAQLAMMAPHANGDPESESPGFFFTPGAMPEADNCWIQRFANDRRALARLREAVELLGSCDTTREAFAQGLIRDGDLWMVTSGW